VIARVAGIVADALVFLGAFAYVGAVLHWVLG